MLFKGKIINVKVSELMSSSQLLLSDALCNARVVINVI